MKGNEFLDKMELIDPVYIEAADAAPKMKKKLWTGWRAAVAASICLVLLAGTAAAVSGGGTWLIELFTRESSMYGTEAGYTVGAEIRKFPVSELSDEMQAVGAEIVHQVTTWPTYSRQDPQHWRKDFFSAEEACEFIGLNSLRRPDWDLEEWGTTALVWGSRNGKIRDITIDMVYKEDDITLQVNIDIYTEYSDVDTGEMKVVAQEETEFTETFYTTANGKQCQIISVSAQDNGRMMMDGHLVDNGILYTLFVNYTEQDAARAEELLHQWADMF